jgi:hypothetical protein
MDGLEFPLPPDFFNASSRMYDGTLVALLNMLNSRKYTNANRPDPSTLDEGTMVFNTDIGKPQWVRDDPEQGKIWVDALGNQD